MIAIGSLLALIVLSLVVTRVATLVLVATGVSRTTARFQARSAFTGAGFTTGESEQVVDNPLRRKVIMTLMLLGHVGLVASASTLILGFAHGSASHLGFTATELVVGLGLLVVVSRSRRIDRRLTRLIFRVLRRYSRLMHKDVASLVELADRHAVCEVYVRDGDWVAGRPLGELGIDEEGITVLGVVRPGRPYLAMPSAEVKVTPGETLIVHGQLDAIGELDARRAGEGGEAGHTAGVAAWRRLGRT